MTDPFEQMAIDAEKDYQIFFAGVRKQKNKVLGWTRGEIMYLNATRGLSADDLGGETFGDTIRKYSERI